MILAHEGAFSIDAPGAWTPTDPAEPGSISYASDDGSENLTVILLRVKPLFSIADEKRLLDDYVHHRMSYEKGMMPDLVQSEPSANTEAGVAEASWWAEDVHSGMLQAHRVILQDGVLADFAYSTGAGADPDAFRPRAASALATARIMAAPAEA